MKNIEKPSTEITVSICGNDFNVKFPKSGEMIEIAVLKAKLSDNQYRELLFQNSSESIIAVKLIDAYAFFSVMLPELRESLAKKSLYDLDTLESVDLLHVYDSKINPWLDKWTEVINNRIKELKGEEKLDSKRALV